MNEYMRMFLKYPEKSGCSFRFIHMIEQCLGIENENLQSQTDITDSHSISTERQKVLDMLWYRYGLDVHKELEEILSDYKIRKTNTNFLELFYKVITTVDKHLDFHNVDYFEEFDINVFLKDSEEFRVLFQDFQNIEDDKFLRDDALSKQDLKYTYKDKVLMLVTKLEYVIANLYLIIENMIFREEHHYPASSYFPNVFIESKERYRYDEMARKTKQITDSYLKTELNKFAKNDFVILLTSPHSQFRKYVSERNKSDDATCRIPLMWTGGVDEVRLSAAAAGKSMFSKANMVNSNSYYTNAEYQNFLCRYRMYLNEALRVPDNIPAKNIKQKFFSNKYKNINRLAAYYFSEQIYGFYLIGFIDYCLSDLDSEDIDTKLLTEHLSELIRIPNVTMRNIYVKKMIDIIDVYSPADLRKMHHIITKLVDYEMNVYYPILMIYVLECMEMLFEKDRFHKLDFMLGIENAAKKLDFRTILNHKIKPSKRSVFNDTFEINYFYKKVLNEIYTTDNFEAKFGKRCFDEKIFSRILFYRLYSEFGEINEVDGPADRGTGQ